MRYMQSKVAPYTGTTPDAFHDYLALSMMGIRGRYDDAISTNGLKSSPLITKAN